MQVPIDEAAERLDELVDLVLAGEEVFLTRDGQPAFQLKPYPPEFEANESVQGS